MRNLIFLFIIVVDVRIGSGNILNGLVVFVGICVADIVTEPKKTEISKMET
jgi:hypothetical protein